MSRTTNRNMYNSPVFATILTLLFFTVFISAANLPFGCFNGDIDARTCCAGIYEWYVHLPDPGNCGKFYQCANGRAVHKACPSGLHWSPAADRCEWPEIADCNIFTNIVIEEYKAEPANSQCISGEISPDDCCRNVKTSHKLELPNSVDCSSYYKCVEGKAVLQQCPVGLHWSVKSDRCEFPNEAQCYLEGNTALPSPE